jgi:hypothetical protein
MLFRYDTWVKTAQGPALAGVYVYVCNQPANTSVAPPSPLAAIYSDPNGQFPITQPLQTDGFGHADFYIASGTYTVMVAIGNVVVNVYPDQSIGTLGGINGIIITGTPVAGQALVATSPTTATWETIVGSTLNFPAIPNEFLTSYNSVTGMFAAAQPFLSGIGNPTSNVDFVFNGNTFTRMYSSSMQWNEALINTSIATASQNYNSPAVALMGAIWNGSASVVDTWAIFSTVGTGSNPTSILGFQHIGTSGLATVSVPNLICYGEEFLSGQLFDSIGSAGTLGQVLGTLGGTGTRWINSPNAPTFIGAGLVTIATAPGTVTIRVLGSGSSGTAATAAANFAVAANGDVITADGLGNAQDSGTQLSALALKTQLPITIAPSAGQFLTGYNSASGMFSASAAATVPAGNREMVGVSITGGSLSALPGSLLDYINGTVKIAPPGAGATVAALTVIGDSSSVNDIADFFPNGTTQGVSINTSGGMTIAPPTAGGGSVGLLIEGDTFGNQLLTMSAQANSSSQILTTNWNGTPLASWALDTRSTGAITATSIASNVLSVTYNTGATFNAGDVVTLIDTGEAFLNGQAVTVLASPAPTSTSFHANFTHGNYTNAADTGFVGFWPFVNGQVNGKYQMTTEFFGNFRATSVTTGVQSTWIEGSGSPNHSQYWPQGSIYSDFTGSVSQSFWIKTNTTLATLNSTGWGAAVISVLQPTIDLTAQTGALSAQALFTTLSNGAGQYRITWTAKVTTADSVTSTLGGTTGLRVTYTDADDAVSVTTPAWWGGGNNGTAPTSASLNTTQTQLSGEITVNAAASSSMTFAFGYTAATPNMQYSLHIRVEAI